MGGRASRDFKTEHRGHAGGRGTQAATSRPSRSALTELFRVFATSCTVTPAPPVGGRLIAEMARRPRGGLGCGWAALIVPVLRCVAVRVVAGPAVVVVSVGDRMEVVGQYVVRGLLRDLAAVLDGGTEVDAAPDPRIAHVVSEVLRGGVVPVAPPSRPKGRRSICPSSPVEPFHVAPENHWDVCPAESRCPSTVVHVPSHPSARQCKLHSGALPGRRALRRESPGAG